MAMFTKAERKRVSLKIAITGPSGSGKTYSALKLASGMGKKIALLDTENGSGSLYADLATYDTVQVNAPYTIPKYLEVIRAAEAEGYDVLIIDSLSHAWAGEGGLLDQKSAKDARGGNAFTNWAEISKQQEALKAALLATSLHLICTMRSKQDYVQSEDERGKKSVQKVGMAPIQRDGMEYEFTTVFDCDMQHYAIASKDRTGLFDGTNGQINEKYGQRLQEWLQGGAPLTVVQGGQDANEYGVSELVQRRLTAFKAFKEHFTKEAILKVIPLENVAYYGENIHLGKTFEGLSAEQLDEVDAFMAAPPKAEATA